MKKALYLLLAVLCLASCQEELSPEFQSGNNVLYASMESIDATRTSMDESNNILWSEEDQIIAFMKTTLGTKYQIKEQYVGTTTGGFSKVQGSGSGDDIDPGQVIDHNVIIYPYSDQVWCMKYGSDTPAKSYKLNVVLPETQIYAENSFAEGALPMVAVSTDNQLSFKNICGALKLQFKGVDKIQSIRLEGLNDEAISGKSSVIAYADGSAPTITMAAKASTSVTLDCGDGVQLNESTPTTFIIAVPPVTFSSGMKITVTDTDGLSKTLTNNSSNTIKRSSLLTFPVITYKQDGVLDFPENTMTSYDFPAEGGTVEIPVITNLDYEVMIPDNAKDWISVADTKTIREEVITLSVAANSIASTRSAEISVTDSGESVLQTITINQEAAICDIDDSQFNPDLYLRYVRNSYYDGYGDAYDYNMYYYASYIYNRAFAKASKVEYKFQLASVPEYECHLSVVEDDDDGTDKIYFSKNGLSVHYDSFTWADLGINPTDVIVLSFEGNTMTLNGKTFTLSYIHRGGYIFSGYYYDRDDGVYSKYYSFQDNAKLFYAKGWDADGKLIYLGGPAIAVGPSGSDEACWKSVYYYDNRISTQYDFAYYTDQQEYTPYGFGNLLGPEEEIPTSPADNEIWYTSTNGVVTPRYTDGFGATIISNTCEDGKGVIKFDGPVTSIGEYAFFESTRLTSITIPDGVTTIENGSFTKCYNLAEFKGKFAADNGRILSVDGVLAAFAPAGLSEYTIPDYITAIGYEAFRECDNLTDITIPNSVTMIDGHAFQNCDNITEITIPGSVLSIGEYAFDYCYALADVHLGYGVSVIEYLAFYGCQSLKSITIPDSVTEIGSEAFYGCTSLESVTLGKGLPLIEGWMFAKCSKLTDVYIPDNIKEIKNCAFQECTSLASIVIPSSVTQIGANSFAECMALKEVYCKRTTPPWGGNAMFSYFSHWNGSTQVYKPLDCKIYVPAQSLSQYKTEWVDYANMIYAMPLQ